MEHLTTLDAGFLEAEDSDRHVSLAIGGLTIMEGPIPDYDSIVSRVADRVAAIPRYTQVLRIHPLDLGAPEWVDDPNFDLAHHVHRAAVPQPGDDRALFRLAAEIMERRLDRDRPLWESWIIEGLADDRWAMLTKLHHCIADGIAATRVLVGLSDEGDGESYASHIRAAKQVSHRGVALPKPSLDPRNWVSDMWHASAAVTSLAARAAEGAIELAAGLMSPAPASSLTGPVTNLRRYSAARVSLDDLKKVCRAFDVTLNDVALAAITDSYRATLLRRGEQPRRNSLRTLVPVSVRSANAFDGTGNKVSAMLPFLPVEQEDPVEQLRLVHRRLAKTKTSGQRQAGSAVMSAANYIPFMLTAWTVRVLTRLPQRGVVALATNVPGPSRQLRIMGRNVVHMLPIPPIALGLRTGIAMLTYDSEMAFGITADFDAAPDVAELAQGIEHGVARLVAVSEERLATAIG
jgi:diacylglycerol O-acyltransferase / wax synthase